MRNLNLLVIVAVSGALTACGDYVESQGKLGRMTFSLAADYELEASLSQAGIITGHSQEIRTGVTRRGAKQIRQVGLVTYQLNPSANTEVFFYAGLEGNDQPPDVLLTVYEPGDYVLEAVQDGEVVDYLPLRFRRPQSFEMVSWIRPPGEDDFDESQRGNVYTVVEGAQIAMLPIPNGANGERLVGEFATTVSHTPEWAAIYSANVLDVYEENGVWGSVVSESMVFTEEADVVITIEDVLNGVVETIEVTVTERPKTP